MPNTLELLTSNTETSSFTFIALCCDNRCIRVLGFFATEMDFGHKHTNPPNVGYVFSCSARVPPAEEHLL